MGDKNSQKLTLRETTLMPNIKGFGPLIGFLFAPTIQLKRDQTKSRFKSFIAGLGYDEDKNHATFEEHDCSFALDAEFTQIDFDQVMKTPFRSVSINFNFFFAFYSQINQIRYCFDSLLFTYVGQIHNTNIPRESKSMLMLKIRDLITE